MRRGPVGRARPLRGGHAEPQSSGSLDMPDAVRWGDRKCSQRRPPSSGCRPTGASLAGKAIPTWVPTYLSPDLLHRQTSGLRSPTKRPLPNGHRRVLPVPPREYFWYDHTITRRAGDAAIAMFLRHAAKVRGPAGHETPLNGRYINGVSLARAYRRHGQPALPGLLDVRRPGLEEGIGGNPEHLVRRGGQLSRHR